jgi:hypothetical protein
MSSGTALMATDFRLENVADALSVTREPKRVSSVAGFDA